MEEAAKDKSIYKILFDPYGLNPNDSQRGDDQPDLAKVIYEEESKSWIAPFIMAGINTKVVRRSHALSAYPYGAIAIVVNEDCETVCSFGGFRANNPNPCTEYQEGINSARQIWPE